MVVVVPAIICVFCCICCCVGEEPPRSRRESKSLGRGITQIASSAFLTVPATRPATSGSLTKLSYTSGSSLQPEPPPFQQEPPPFQQEPPPFQQKPPPSYDNATTFPKPRADLTKEEGGDPEQSPDDWNPPPTGTLQGVLVQTQTSKCQQQPAGNHEEQKHSINQNQERLCGFETPV